MNKIFKLSIMALAVCTTMTGCLDETVESRTYASQDQLDNAPKNFKMMSEALTAALCGSYVYIGNAKAGYANDWGYPSIMIQNDIMGQDIVPANLDGTEWFLPWYKDEVALGAQYAYGQMPWSYYYGWINNCNVLLGVLGGQEPTESQKAGAGEAYALRAMFYLDLVRMYAPETYAKNPDAPTVPKKTETMTKEQSQHNRRMTNKEAFEFILSDLDKAEEYLSDYSRADVYTPDVSVVYGLKARAYLTMEDWKNAEKYAKLAQKGYAVMTDDQYTSRDNGFAEPTDSWMFAVKFKSTDYIVTNDDGDDCWAAKMVDESASGCGYGANYGQPFYIDAHLYSTVPSSDFRKKCFVNFHADEALDSIANANKADGKATTAEKAALKAKTNKAIDSLFTPYSNYPSVLYADAAKPKYDGLNIKFRNAGGAAGVESQYVGWCVAVPLMRVEEMKLIEAEAVGMQPGRLEEGIRLLTEFAKTRDPKFVYGKHNEAYGNSTTSAFQNEIYWQKRIEFWGEGISYYDARRLNKGIIRSYPGTNHPELCRWNTEGNPTWMTRIIPQAETSYNFDCTNNSYTSAPTSDSPEYIFK